jgi:hypothetical protein
MDYSHTVFSQKFNKHYLFPLSQEYNLYKSVSAYSWHCSVGIAPGYGLDCRGIWVRFSAEATDLFLLHSVQTVSGIHTGSYATGAQRSFPGGMAVVA